MCVRLWPNTFTCLLLFAQMLQFGELYKYYIMDKASGASRNFIKMVQKAANSYLWHLRKVKVIVAIASGRPCICICICICSQGCRAV